MSLDNIQLSPLIIGEWYKDTLLVSPDGPPAIQRPAPPPQSVPQPQSMPPSQSMSQPQSAPQPAATQSSPKAPPPPEPIAPQPVVEQPKIATQPPAPERTPEPAAEAPYKFLGKNSKKITILVQSPNIPFLPDNQLAFLTKILEACRMNIGDVAIVNTATAPVNIATLKQQLQPTAILLFGLEPTAIKLPINFPEFKVQPYDSCSYLSAPPLTRLVAQSEESKLLKSKLWVCLKTLFNV